MKQQEVFKKIGEIIKELNDQYEYLKTVDGQLNELELELFIANSHFLTDHIAILNKLNLQNIPAQNQPEREHQAAPPKPIEQHRVPHKEKYFEPLVQPVVLPDKSKPVEPEIIENKQAAGSPNTDEDKYTYPQAEKEPETIRHELILDENWDEGDEHFEDEEPEHHAEETNMMAAPEIPAAKTEIPKPVVKTTHPHKIKETAEEKIVITINEKISAQMGEKNGVGDQLKGQKISDLKSAISLNDKMLYVKDLFNGYNLAYSEAIDILNRFSSFDEADLFLKRNYVVKNNWDGKPETTSKFFDLLRRRYT